MPKTGTTFLQENIFPKLKDLNFYRGWSSFRELTKINNSNPVLISDESMLGDIFSGSFNNDFIKKCNKIKTVFGDPDIIIGFREQQDFIKSLYKQRLNQGGTEEFKDFFNIENTGLIKIEDLIYYDKLKFLKENFSNVYVYSFDDFINDKQNFITDLLSFLNVSITDFNDELKNKGSVYDYQLKRLLKYNKLNEKFQKLPFSISLYNPLFKKLKITPRNIFTKNVNKPNRLLFDLSLEIQHFISLNYSEDWKKTISIR